MCILLCKLCRPSQDSASELLFFKIRVGSKTYLHFSSVNVSGWLQLFYHSHLASLTVSSLLKSSDAEVAQVQILHWLVMYSSCWALELKWLSLLKSDANMFAHAHYAQLHSHDDSSHLASISSLIWSAKQQTLFCISSVLPCFLCATKVSMLSWQAFFFFSCGYRIYCTQEY